MRKTIVTFQDVIIQLIQLHLLTLYLYQLIVLMRPSLILILGIFCFTIINSQKYNCSIAPQSFCGLGLCTGYAYTNNACVSLSSSVCPTNFRFSNSSNACVNCSGLVSQNCTTSCSDFMFDGITSTCVSCTSTYGIGCSSCNSSSCLTCSTGYSIGVNQTYCVGSSCTAQNCLTCRSNLARCQVCQRGFALNLTTFTCQAATCRINYCLTCNSTNCTLCSSNYMLSDDGSSCLPICTDRFCTNCLAPGICSTCSAGYILNTRTYQCVKECSNNAVKNCFQCSNNFLCQACLPNYGLIQEGVLCVPQGCTANCMRCSSDSTTCLICNAGFTPTVNSTTNQTICSQAVCTIKYCSECLNETRLCKMCASGYTLSADNKTCQHSCASNITNCKVCSVNNTCDTCAAGFKRIEVITTISDTNCTNSSNSSNSSGCNPQTIISWRCDAICNITNCTLCSSSTACAACATGLVLSADKTKCVLPCNIDNCANCTGQNICGQCMKNYNVQKNGTLCIQTVKDGSVNVTHLNGTSQIKTCSSFFDNCSICNSTHCRTCVDKFTLSLTGKQCIQCSGIILNCLRCTVFQCQQCSYPYSLSNNKCVNCSLAKCQTCSENSTTCQTCETGFKVQNGSCVAAIVCTERRVFQNGFCQCPTGLYWNGASCAGCSDSNCVICTSSSCSACTNGYYPSGNTCFQCITNCQICTSATQCLSCAYPFSLVNGVCRKLGGGSSGCEVPGQSGILRCPVGCAKCQVDDNNALICLTAVNGYVIFGGVLTKCNSTCQTCSPTNPNTCLSCFRRNRLVGGLCLRCTGFQARTCLNRDRNYSTSCLIGFTVVSTPGVCTACSENCARCFINGAGKCDPGKCINGYVYSASTQNCTSCFDNCPVCDPNDFSICLSCGQRRFKNTTTNKCVSCPIQCSSCTNNTVCTSCENRYTLVGSTCKRNPDYPYSGYSIDGNFTCFIGFTLTNNECVFNLTCNSSGACYGCSYGNFLSSGYCYSCSLNSGCKNCFSNSTVKNCDLCNDGFYLSDGACEACSTGCSICNDKQNCLRPSDGYYIIIDTQNNPTGQCLACTFPCATCVREPTFCTSCVSRFTIEGSSCFSDKLCKLNVVYRAKFFASTDSNATKFRKLYMNMGTVRSSFCASMPFWIRLFKCSRLLKFRRCKFGSLQIDADVDVSTATNAATATSDIQSSLNLNGIDGQAIISSAIVSEGFQDSNSKTNLGLILGVSIPLGLIFILIIFLMIRNKRKAEQIPDSWQNLEGNVETDQKIAGQI